MSEDWDEKGELMNQIINDIGDCRTDPATQGLLIIEEISSQRPYLSQKVFLNNQTSSPSYCQNQYSPKLPVPSVSQTYIDVHGSVANWSLGQIFITSIQISLIILLFFCFRLLKAYSLNLS